ncbi:MAG TPA: helix-turn-helix domain-containing protein [Gaiellaceae bacterium]|nr:helix-turn-helix domain-containing protein [Gaiellaceae bacterium]
MSEGQLSVQQVAEELGRTVDEVRGLIREGELQTLHCGIRPGLVPRREVDAYVRRVRARQS